MNASKSAQLLMQAFNFQRQGKSFVIFKPSMDTRDRGYVKSRALRESREAYCLENYNIEAIETIVKMEQPDFIFVDELQFLTGEQVRELTRVSIKYDIPIFAYGLLITYNGILFEASRTAIECGYTLKEIKMQCDFCKNKSTHHLLYNDGKLIKDGNGIFVGDTEYKSVCYECYHEQMQ